MQAAPEEDRGGAEGAAAREISMNATRVAVLLKRMTSKRRAGDGA